MKIFIPVIFLLLLTCCSKKGEIVRIDGSKIGESKLTAKIKSLMQSANVTGLTIAVFNDNEVVYQKALVTGMRILKTH